MLGEKKDDQTPPANPWIEKLPEQYRSNPDQYFEDYGKLQREFQVAKQHQDWYEGQYKPWASDHIALPKSDYTQYQEWVTSRQAKPAGITPQTPQEPQLSEIDWSDPAAPEQAFKRVVQHNQELTQQLASMSQQFEVGRDHVLELMRLTEQARQIEREEDLKFFGQPKDQGGLGYAPRTNIKDVAKYAGEHGLNDLRQAWKELYETANLDDVRRQSAEEAYAKGKTDAMQEFTNQRVTTERSTGLPARITVHREASIPRGYGAKGREEMIADLMRKHTQPA